MKALVVGGGVGGPAVALFLRRLGWDVEIIEAARQPDAHAGAFLNVATNGLAVLTELGVTDRLRTDAHPCPHMVMWSGRGKRLGEVPNGPAGQPERGSVIVRRGWLQQVLREAALEANVPVTFGARLASLEEHPGGMLATTTDGRLFDADVVIGADGIGSVTRRFVDRGGLGADVQRIGRSGRLRPRHRVGADAGTSTLRLRAAFVLRLPRPRRRHGLLVRQFDPPRAES